MVSNASETVDFSEIFSLDRSRNLDDYIEFKIYFDDHIRTPFQNNDSLSKRPVKENIDFLISHKYTIPSLIKDWENQKIKNNSKKKEDENQHVYESIINELEESSFYINDNFFEEYIKLYDKYFLPLVNRYMWTGQPFFVVYIPGNKEGPGHLCGRFRTADNVQENWLVTNILFEITLNNPHVSITVDSYDGNFLLIEFALNIPNWFTPETVKNRVFLRAGKLYFLPKKLPERYSSSQSVQDYECVFKNTSPFRSKKLFEYDDTGEEITSICISDALMALKYNCFDLYKAPNIVQEDFEYKLGEYAQVCDIWLGREIPLDPNSKEYNILKLNSCMPHSCNIIVPVPIARMFTEYPQLIGLAEDHIPPYKDIYKKCITLNNTKVPLLDCNSFEMARISVRINRSQYSHLQSTRFALPFGFHSQFSDSFKPFLKSLNIEDHSKAKIEMTRGLYMSVGLLIAYIESQGYTDELICFLHNSEDTNIRQVCERFSNLLNKSKQWCSMEENKTSIPEPVPVNKQKLIEELDTSGEKQSYKTVRFIEKECKEKPRTTVMTQKKSKLKKPKKVEDSYIKNTLESLFTYMKIPFDNSVTFRDVIHYLYYNSTYPIVASTEEDDSLEWLESWATKIDETEKENLCNLTEKTFEKFNKFLNQKEAPLIIEENNEFVNKNESDLENISEDNDSFYSSGSESSDNSQNMVELMKEMDKQLKTFKLGRVKNKKEFTDSSSDDEIDNNNMYFREKNPAELNNEELKELFESNMKPAMKSIEGITPSPASLYLSMFENT